MSKAPPAFQFYPADWLADGHVMAMDEREEGVYIRLMSICWREGSLPADPVELAKLTKGRCEVPPIVRDRFVISAHDATRLVHPRLEAERKKQQEWHESMSEAGKLGARKRWNTNRKKRNGQAIAKPSNSQWLKMPLQSSSSSSSSEKKEKKDTHHSARARDPSAEQPEHGAATAQPVAAGPEQPKPLHLRAAMAAMSEGSGGRFAVSPFPEGIAPRLETELRSLVAQGVTVDDLRAAGAFLATWDFPVGPSYLAKGTNFADVIAKAKSWSANGKTPRARGSPRSGRYELTGRENYEDTKI